MVPELFSRPRIIRLFAAGVGYKPRGSGIDFIFRRALYSTKDARVVIGFIDGARQPIKTREEKRPGRDVNRNNRQWKFGGGIWGKRSSELPPVERGNCG